MAPIASLHVAPTQYPRVLGELNERGPRVGPFIREFGAGRGNRTPTLLPELDFESSASTNSAIPAAGSSCRVGGIPRSRCRRTAKSALSAKSHAASNAASMQRLIDIRDVRSNLPSVRLRLRIATG